MRLHRLNMLVGSMALAAVVVAGAPRPVAAGEFVAVTDITFDRVAHLCGEGTASGCVVLTGTMTCEANGLAELVSFTLEQGRVRGTDNLDLLDFACSTEPRTFTVIAETFGCGSSPSTCFRPGAATVTAAVGPAVIEQHRVLVRKA